MGEGNTRVKVLHNLALAALQRDLAHFKPTNFEIESKDSIRELYRFTRLQAAKQNARVLGIAAEQLSPYFANGAEVDPNKFSPVLVAVAKETFEADLFNAATLLWSIPVSRGYGRRLRFLVFDEYNGKLVGVIGLCDPVYSLAQRDRDIGWNDSARQVRLYNVLEAYALGAVPPYSFLLAGKFVALAALSQPVTSLFRDRYASRRGHGSGITDLAAITTSSALGRSSLYNRLRIPGEAGLAYRSVGFSVGWGHFHISEKTLEAMRNLLREKKLGYADDYEYGGISNWRFRTIRRGLQELGLSPRILAHGIRRELFIAPTLANYREVLMNGHEVPVPLERPLKQMAEGFKSRWMIARSERVTEWCTWSRNEIASHFKRLHLEVESRQATADNRSQEHEETYRA